MARVEGVPDGLLAAIRIASGLPDVQWAVKPIRLEGGSWADTYKVRLKGWPGLEKDLVARVMPEPDSWNREMLVQGHVAKSGFAAPVVHLGSLPTPDFDRAWMLMDFDPGERLFGNPTSWAIFRSMFDRRHRVAHFLAEVTVAVHAIDASPIARDLAGRGTVGPGLNWFYSRASALGDPALMERAERLFATRPPFIRSVLCHGDIHPLNILHSPGRDTLIDWTHAQYDDPLYDVAFTWLGMTLMPLPAPDFLRPVIAAYGRRLGARFLANYERASGAKVDQERLDWFVRLVALRIYVEAGEARRKGLTATHLESAALLFEPYLKALGI